MNVTAKKKIEKMMSQVEDLKIALEEILDKAQDDFTSKSDKWQESEKGEEAQAAIDCLESAVSALDDTFENLENSIQ